HDHAPTDIYTLSLHDALPILFAADLAFLQDFYGVINFGSQEEYHALLAAQQSSSPPPTPISPEAAAPAASPASAPPAAAEVSVRSEEHTSELQSRSDLVCRLL